MAEINWNLLQPVDVGAQAQQGFATGMAMVRQGQARNALKHYLANPDDQSAYSALAYYDPQTATAMERQRSEQRRLLLEQQERQRQTAIGQLFNQDPVAARRAALDAGDFDLAQHLDALEKPARDRLGAFYKSAGPLAYQMRQMSDPEQRKSFLQQNRGILEATGIDPRMIDNFDVTNDQALDGLIAANRTVDQMIDDNKITWHQQGEQPSFATDAMGRPVGTANPARVGSPPPSGSGDAGRNNPGALRKPGSTEFQSFPTEEAGIAAQEAQLGRYLSRGIQTPADIIETYAPRKSRGGDNTDAQVNNYIQYVGRRTGLDVRAPISAEQVPLVAAAMREFETGRRGSGQLRLASQGGVPHVDSKADYDRLPKGTTYIAPDGSRRVKS